MAQILTFSFREFKITVIKILKDIFENVGNIIIYGEILAKTWKL